MVNWIDTAEMEQRIRNTRVIDVRDKEYYYIGHIEGACWMPYLLMINNALEVLHPDETVILYDENGNTQGRAKKIADILGNLGFHNIYIYQEGWAGWEKAHPTGLKDSFISI